MEKTSGIAVRRRLLGVVLLAGAIWPVAVLAAPPIRVTFDAQNPPFMYASPHGPVGLYPEIIRAAFGAMQRDVQLESRPWSRALAELDAGLTAVGGIYKTEARAAKYDFSEPLFVERILVYSPPQRPVAFRNLGDLHGLTVGVIRGWSYGDAFDAARAQGLFRVDAADSDEQNFAKLNAGRLDALLAIDAAARGVLTRRKDLAAVAAPVPLAENPTYLAFHKKSLQQPLLLDFNAAVERLRRSGKLDAMVDRILSSEAAP